MKIKEKTSMTYDARNIAFIFFVFNSNSNKTLHYKFW